MAVRGIGIIVTVGTVILGASHTGQLLQNFDALELLPRITPELAARLDAL